MISPGIDGIISCKASGPGPGLIYNLGNQVLDDNRRFYPIFSCDDFYWQDRFSLWRQRRFRRIRNCFWSCSFFKLLAQVIVFEIGFVLLIPICTLPSMELVLAVWAACFLPSFLSDVRQKPFPTNTAGALSTWFFCHSFSPEFKSGQNIRVEPVCVKLAAG